MININKSILSQISRRARVVSVIVILTQLAACGSQPLTEETAIAEQFSTEVSVCRDLLASVKHADASELDASNISLFNWNVQKTRESKWQEDFETFSKNADLVLFQEASLREANIEEIDASKHWTFAPGYRKKGEVTGVMTLSSIKPLTQCSFMHKEPLLRTPKATSVTQYALTETDQTLVVVNVHAVNFSLGLGAFDEQFGQIHDLLQGHDGPVILSGDFNTWRQKRVRLVEELASDLELTAIEFENDNRVRVFGNTIDHIYVRGLHTVDSGTEIVETSDHNPMSVVLSIFSM